MSKFSEKLKMPEWFNKENETLEIMGKNTYTLVLDKNQSGEKELVYLVYNGDNENGDEDALIYIYYDGFIGAQFRDYGENNNIDFEEAKAIIYYISQRFKLPLKYIPINFHRQNRKDDAPIEVEKRENILLNGR